MANSKFQIEKGMLFRIFLSKFNTVDAFFFLLATLANQGNSLVLSQNVATISRQTLMAFRRELTVLYIYIYIIFAKLYNLDRYC